MLNIIVCMKIVIDPEMPFSQFKIDRANRKQIPPPGVPPLFSPFDLNALEAALKIKDSQECRITVISMGKTLPKALLQKALAAGADEVVALEDPLFEDLGSLTTARVLSTAIEKIGAYNLVLTGRQSADWDSGTAWAGIAEILDLPCITCARNIKVDGQIIVVERCAYDSIEVVESPLPSLVTITSEVGDLRFITMPAMIKAKKKEIIKWSAPDVEFKQEKFMELKDLFIPEVEAIDSYLVPGETAKEKGHNLAKRLIDNKILTRRG